MAAARQTYWDLSLFGGLADKSSMTDRTALHVTSGEAAQWPSKLPLEIARPYAAAFGPALQVLGYAQDDSWVEQCRPADALAA